MSTPTTGNEIQSEAISRIKANDEQTLRTLYAANYPNVEKFILRNSGSEEDAKDIYQEAFITTWRSIMLDKFTVLNEGSIGGYLFRVAKNKWMDALRERRKNMSGMADMKLQDAMRGDPAFEEEDYMGQVRKHFLVMGAPCKELLQKFYFGKESLRQIAAHFAWTEATAKNNKYRCLQKLRAAILNDKQTGS